jgi:hypothetical protein
VARVTKGDDMFTKKIINNMMVLTGTLRIEDSPTAMGIMGELNYLADTYKSIIIDITELVFCNSYCINLFSKFIINHHDDDSTLITIVYVKTIPWQKKMLTNLTRVSKNLKVVEKCSPVES